MTHNTDLAAAMRAALHAARQGPQADPNPRVGAVVIDSAGAIAGVGHHAGAGTPHAEVAALDQAGEHAAGATVVVTLEPCAHTGRTPPCTEALIRAGVAQVHYAVPDPSAEAGQGAEALGRHGIHSSQWQDPDLAEQARALVADWSAAIRRGRPTVVWKAATTLDGRIAAADGTSAWITSPQARADAHDLRAACGAVIVGTGTALADDPSLTARWPDGTLRPRQPLRAVVGNRDLPTAAKLHDDAAPTLNLPTHDPHEVLERLHARGVRRALLEGGPTLAAAFWHAGLVDELVTYLAPALLGTGAPASTDLGISTMAQIARWEFTDITPVGPDVRLTARPTPTEV